MAGACAGRSRRGPRCASRVAPAVTHVGWRARRQRVALRRCCHPGEVGGLSDPTRGADPVGDVHAARAAPPCGRGPRVAGPLVEWSRSWDGAAHPQEVAGSSCRQAPPGRAWVASARWTFRTCRSGRVESVTMSSKVQMSRCLGACGWCPADGPRRVTIRRGRCGSGTPVAARPRRTPRGHLPNVGAEHPSRARGEPGSNPTHPPCGGDVSTVR